MALFNQQIANSAFLVFCVGELVVGNPDKMSKNLKMVVLDTFT